MPWARPGHALGTSRFSLHLALEALAPHLVGVPPVVAHQLEDLVGDVLGDGRDEVAGLKDLEITPDLGIESRAVDDRVPGVVGVHFIQRKGVTDDVLGEAFEILGTGQDIGNTCGSRHG